MNVCRLAQSDEMQGMGARCGMCAGHGQVGQEEESGGQTVSETTRFSIQEWSPQNIGHHFVARMTHLRPWWKIHIPDGWCKTVRVRQ